MGYAIELYCGNCGWATPHDVKKTLPGQFHLTRGPKGSYRVRLRLCNRCEKELETVELPLETFQSLVRQIEKSGPTRNAPKKRPRLWRAVANVPAALELLVDVHGSKPRVRPTRLSLQQLMACVAAVNRCRAKLSGDDRKAVAAYYGLPSTSVTTDTAITWHTLVRRLRHPSREKYLEPAYKILWPEG
jgi:hypothetical protein